MRMLIIGGGIAGLTLANLVIQRGITPVVVEKEPDWSQKGYALGLWPIGSSVLKGIGLYDAFYDSSVEAAQYHIANDQGKVMKTYEMEKMFAPRDMMRMLKRSELLRILASGIENRVDLRMNTTVEQIEQNAQEVEVTFNDGTQETFDFVVGSDGIHSKTRTMLFGKIPLESTGWGGWAWWIDPSISPQSDVTEYWGTGRFFGLYPAKEVLFCFVGMPSKEIGEHRNKPNISFIREHFRHFGGAVPSILQSLDQSENLFYWGFEDLRMKQWYKGRVLLLGDACSAILPTAGIGASSAMESAAVLADELSRTDARQIDIMLKSYYKRRFDRVDQIQKASRGLANIMFKHSRLACTTRNMMLKMIPDKMMYDSFQKLMDGRV